MARAYRVLIQVKSGVAIPDKEPMPASATLTVAGPGVMVADLKTMEASTVKKERKKREPKAEAQTTPAADAPLTIGTKMAIFGAVRLHFAKFTTEEDRATAKARIIAILKAEPFGVDSIEKLTEAQGMAFMGVIEGL